MKRSKMSIKKAIALFGTAGLFAGAMACNSPQNQNDTQDMDPGTDNMYEEPMPSHDTTSAVDTTLTDTLDSGF